LISRADALPLNPAEVVAKVIKAATVESAALLMFKQRGTRRAPEYARHGGERQQHRDGDDGDTLDGKSRSSTPHGIRRRQTPRHAHVIDAISRHRYDHLDALIADARSEHDAREAATS
jgi:hypothetical protein